MRPFLETTFLCMKMCYRNKLDMPCLSSDPPSVKLSSVTSRSNNSPLTLYCDVESFYPEEASISWLQNGTALPVPPTPEQNPDGTFRTRHYYTLSLEQRERGGMVECAVNQPGVASLSVCQGSSSLHA
uniref:Ig-like domain-containing protein n=1 Tax=Monopterus albus TaxID=43700 RepID=A0A3Q3JX69_MONAL